MATRAQHSARPGRESLSKRLGKTARRIKARDGHRCIYCGVNAEESGAHLHLDHLTPKSKGGQDVPRNLALACRRCNSARQDRPLAAWLAYAEELGIELRVSTARQIRGLARRKLPEVVPVRRAS